MDDNDMENNVEIALVNRVAEQDTWLDRLSYRRLLAVAGSMLIAVKAPEAVLRKVFNNARRLPRNLRRTDAAQAARQALVAEMKRYLHRHRSLDPLLVKDIERPHEERFPERSEWGTLPPGFWHVSFTQLVEKLAFNSHRRTQVELLLKALTELKRGGCKKVIIAGSFVSTKPKPSDIDLVWDKEGLDKQKLHKAFEEDNGSERQKLFGLDASAEEWKLKLSMVQSLWGPDAPESSEFANDEYEQLPRFRAVGVLVLDLTQELPAIRR